MAFLKHNDFGNGSVHSMEEPALMVRPLKPGEGSLWLSVTMSPQDSAEKVDEFEKYFEKFRASEPLTFLVALSGDGRCAGRLQGFFLEPGLYSVENTAVSESFDSSLVHNAFGAYLHAAFFEKRVKVLSWLRDEEAVVNRMLENSGFILLKKKVFVERSLEGFTPDHEDPFIYETLSQVGRDRFLDIMIESESGDPFEEDNNTDPAAKFEELVEFAGSLYDPEKWFVAFLDGEPAGIILPQIYEEDPTTGTIFYIGVLPAFRGRGYGTILHARGLFLLAECGAKNYFGSTDPRNTPMIRVFERNGCVQTDEQLFYSPSSENIP